MRTRAALLAALLCTALAACSDDGDEPESKKDVTSGTPSAKTTDTTIVDCEQFAGTSAKITDAQAALYGSDAAARTEAIRTLVEELEEFARAVRGDGEPEMDGERSTASLAVILAGIRSASERRRVEVREMLA